MIARSFIVVALIMLSSPSAGLEVIGIRRRSSEHLALTAELLDNEVHTCVTNPVIEDNPMTVVLAETSTVVISREGLQKRARNGQTRVVEEKRVREEAERLREKMFHEALLREVETYALTELDRCVKACLAQASKHGAMSFMYNLLLIIMRYDKEHNAIQVVRLREVLERELPLRLQGVDFKLTEHWDTTYREGYVRGFRIDLHWEAK